MAVTVGILMATFNGARFLDEQLLSIERQSHADWHLSVSDDGSTDATRDIIEAFRCDHPGQVEIVAGPGKGFAANFLSLVQSPGVKADYWAFCDQDDHWYDDKLQRAVQWLDQAPATLPALYCSRTRLIDADGRSLGLSPDWSRTISFRNALVQNIASGNTMVFNESARDLLSGFALVDAPFHDWLLYLVVTGCGGRVLFDHVPQVDYRQHGGNAMGPWGGAAAHWQRLKIVAGGTYGDWMEANLAALQGIEHRLSDETRELMEQLKSKRKSSGFARVMQLRRVGVYHQSPVATLLLMAAAISGKV